MKVLVVVLLVCTVAGASAQVVDGKVTAGEYTHAVKVLDGAGTLSWSGDGKGGFSAALSVKSKGWAAVGFGSQRMSGADIFMGFVGPDGKGSFAEQVGKGHRHADGKKLCDQSVVVRSAGVTVVEFHIPAGVVPFSGKSVPFIAAFSDSADFTTFHEENVDAGTIALP